MKTFSFSSQDLHSKTNQEVINEIKNVEKKLNIQQVRVLVSIHLRGYTGGMGSMKQSERGAFLKELITNGYLTKNGNVTQKALNEITA